MFYDFITVYHAFRCTAATVSDEVMHVHCRQNTWHTIITAEWNRKKSRGYTENRNQGKSGRDHDISSPRVCICV